MKHETPDQPLPVASMFCGAGGLDLGFSQAGFSTVWAADSMPAAVETFNHNHPGRPARGCDLMQLGVDGVLSALADARVCPVGVLGGPPCQGFSNGNVSAERCRDTRNELPVLYARIVSAMCRQHPVRFFVFENVPGLRRAKHAQRLSDMRHELAKDFTIHEYEVDALEFGVPQKRPRLIWVGLRGPGPAAFEGPVKMGDRKSVRQVIEGLPEPSYWARSAEPDPFHPNHWTMVPRSSRFSNGEFNRGRSFRILGWDEPSPAVAYGHREIHIHPVGHRRLSILEAMLLQGFPQTYELKGSLSEQVTQVSNAVPPPMAHGFATAIYAHLQKGSP